MKILIQVVLSFLLVFFCGTKAFGQTIRKNYRELSNDEKQVFANALYALKQSGIIDEYANLHSQEFNQGIHNSEDFLPWHRWFIYYFEKALQNSGVAGANKIALPFWDWTSQFIIPFRPIERLQRHCGTMRCSDNSTLRGHWAEIWAVWLHCQI